MSAQSSDSCLDLFYVLWLTYGTNSNMVLDKISINEITKYQQIENVYFLLCNEGLCWTQRPKLSSDDSCVHAVKSKEQKSSKKIKKTGNPTCPSNKDAGKCSQ